MSDTSLLFRTSRGVAHDFWHSFLVAGLLLGMLLGAYAVVNANFHRLWIDLQSVEIADHKVNQSAKLKAWREIKRDGIMTYSVTIRRADTHEYICGSDEPERIPYSTRANAKQPLPTSLAKWFGKAGDYQRLCESQADYGAGYYYANSCHIKRLLGFITFKRCVPSNVFLRSL